MIDTKEYLVEFLRKNSSTKGLRDEELLNIDYLASGLIDSLEFMEMVSEIEKKFRVHFSASDLESQEFRNLASLNRIIDNLKQKNIKPK